MIASGRGGLRGLGRRVFTHWTDQMPIDDVLMTFAFQGRQIPGMYDLHGLLIVMPDESPLI